MLQIRKRIYMGIFKVVFSVAIIVMVWVFLNRTFSGSEITPMSDGQIIRLTQQYTMGMVNDRNDIPIVWGEDKEIVWENTETKIAFEEILGVDIKSTTNSKMTVAGKCSWIFGSEDNGFTLDALLHPVKERVGGNVCITLDKDLQIYITHLLKEKGYAEATVMVSNWKTGEILAAIGPVFSESYHPGSTIKPILTAAILNCKPELADYTYNCIENNHNFVTSDGRYRINCINNISHGLLCQEDALTYSCNGYFVSLIQQISREELKKELEKWGFDSVKKYNQFMYWDHKFLNGSSKEVDYLLAAIGQGNCYSTVAGLNFCTNALLNGGTLNEPVLLLKKQSMKESEWTDIKTTNTYEICDKDVAETVVNMMRKVNEKGTGKSFYLPGFACKTGTAQKASADGDISDRYTVWTTGGLISDDRPYSVTVCLDNVSENVGSKYAGEIAKIILEYLIGGNNHV